MQAGAKVRASDAVPVAYVQEPSDSSTITTEAVAGTLTFTAVAGAVYETRWNLKLVQSVATDKFLVSIRETNVSGTVVDAWLLLPLGVAGSGIMQSWTINWTAASSGSKSLVVTLARYGGGTGNITRAAKSNYSIRRIA